MRVDDRRAQLLDVARDLLQERGWDAVGMDDLAESAGVSKALLYYYFASKRDLYLALLQASDDEFRALTVTDPSLPPRARLEKALNGYLDYVEANTAIYVAVQRESVSTDPVSRALLEEGRRAVVQRVLDSLGVGAPHPLLLVALRGWIGLVETAAVDWVTAPTVSRGELTRLLSRTLVRILEAVGDVDPSASHRATRSPTLR